MIGMEMGSRIKNELRKRTKIKECIQGNIGFQSGPGIVLGSSQS